MGIDRDVLIVGGGLNGPALALALASAGISSAVIDAAPAETRAEPDFDGRAYALSLSSRRMLDALGLWAGLAPRSQPIERIAISDGRAGEGAAPFALHFDRNEIDEAAMGAIVEDRWLRAALTGQTTSPGIFDVLVLLGRDESLARIAAQAVPAEAGH